MIYLRVIDLFIIFDQKIAAFISGVLFQLRKIVKKFFQIDIAVVLMMLPGNIQGKTALFCGNGNVVTCIVSSEIPRNIFMYAGNKDGILP